MSKVVVLGAGPMGLAAAYQALKEGHDVDLLEAAPEAGGMAGHFDFGGISLERFYHFVCKTDQPTFDLLSELGIAHELNWIETTMGFYANGRLQEWGNPLALLRFKGASWITKLRYAAFAYTCVRRDSWPALENQTAKDWITRWCGRRGYDLFWRPLFDLKFFEYADRISAAWIWTRLRRAGRSRKSMMQEELGYITGGSKTLVDALVRAIEGRGGRIHLGAGARRVLIQDGRVTGVETPTGIFAAEQVLSTIPIPLVTAIIPDLPAALKERYDAIKNIGICCVILKLKRPVTRHFWLNLSGLPFEIPGVIEFSNLRPVGPAIAYAPFYMPVTNPKFSWSDQALIDYTFQCLSTINPALTATDLLDAKVARLRYAQPVCEAGFAAKLPPVQTPIQGLQIADTCFYYPEDRGIAESVKLGREMARSIKHSSRVLEDSQRGPAHVADTIAVPRI